MWKFTIFTFYIEKNNFDNVVKNPAGFRSDKVKFIEMSISQLFQSAIGVRLPLK